MKLSKIDIDLIYNLKLTNKKKLRKMTDEGFEILNKDLKDIMHYDHITKLRDYNPMVIIELSILKGALCESHNNAEWKVALLMSLREKWNTMKECSNLLIEFQNQAYSKL